MNGLVGYIRGCVHVYVYIHYIICLSVYLSVCVSVIHS